jgi:hypothetical protein
VVSALPAFGTLGLPLVFSLAVGTGGQPRVYVYLLPFLCISVAVAADELRRRLLIFIPGWRWAAPLAAFATSVPLLAALSSIPVVPAETGYRDTGSWVHEKTEPGDVVIVPYIVDSAVGYYSDGMTVQRARDAVGEGLRRLFVVERPGTPRFDIEDLMLASNFTTDAADHLDTHRSWSFPADAFDHVVRFGLTTVIRPRQDLRSVDLGALTRTQGWQLYVQTSPDGVEWAQHAHPDGRTSLQLQTDGGAVLHSAADDAVGLFERPRLAGRTRRLVGRTSVCCSVPAGPVGHRC